MPVKKKYVVGMGLRLLGASLLCGASLLAQPALAQTPMPAPACKVLVATGNPEYPPYLWRDPQDDTRLIGANADLMQLLAKEIGTPIDVRYAGSWARVQEEARGGRIDLVAGAFFTQPRLEYMDYFQPAFRVIRSVIWTTQDKVFPYQKWSDLRGRKGLSVINNSLGETFDQYEKNALTIDRVPSLEQAMKMLNLARADYLIYDEDPAVAYAAKLNIAGLKAADVPVSTENLFLTMAQKSGCNSDAMRARIAKAMHKLVQDNLIRKLVDTNLQRWRKQTLH